MDCQTVSIHVGQSHGTLLYDNGRWSVHIVPADDKVNVKLWQEYDDGLAIDLDITKGEQ